MLDGNIFREAKELLKTTPISEMTEEEVTTVKAAMIPLNLPEFQDMTIDEGLDELANIWKGGAQSEPILMSNPRQKSEPSLISNPKIESEPRNERNPEHTSGPGERKEREFGW